MHVVSSHQVSSVSLSRLPVWDRKTKSKIRAVQTPV